MRAILFFQFFMICFISCCQFESVSIKYVLDSENPLFSYLKVECGKDECDTIIYSEIFDNQGISIYEKIYLVNSMNKEFHLYAFADKSKIFVKELVDSSLVNEGYLWMDSNSYSSFTDEFTYEHEEVFSFSYLKQGQWNYSFKDYRLIGYYEKGRKESDWIKYPAEHNVPIEILTYKSDSIVKKETLEKKISVENLEGNWYYTNSRFERDSLENSTRKYITLSRENKGVRRNNTLRWLNFNSDSLHYQNFISCGTGFYANRSSGDFEYELKPINHGLFEIEVNQESFYRIEVLTSNYLVVSYVVD